MMGDHKSFAPLGTLFETVSMIFADAVDLAPDGDHQDRRDGTEEPAHEYRMNTGVEFSEMRFAGRVNNIELSGIRKIFEAAGPGSINLGLGQPDFDTPAHIKEAAVRAICEGKDRLHTGTGIPELRAAIARKLKTREQPHRTAPEQILVTAGASEALHIVMQALVDRGDRVLCPDPGFCLLRVTCRPRGRNTR